MPPVIDGTFLQRAQCLLGLLTFTVFAFAIGRFRSPGRPIPWRLIFWGIGLQLLFGEVTLHTPHLLETIHSGINTLLGFTSSGAEVVFGSLSTIKGVPVTITTAGGSLTGYADTGAYFAFFVVPTIIFFSALTAIAYHLGVMQYIVQGMAWLMSKSLGTSGAESLATATDIFVGQTTAPLVIRPFVPSLTRSELVCVMAGGFSHIASSVLGLYTLWLGPYIPEAGGHLASSGFIAVPASLMVAKLIMPETETPQTASGVEFKIERVDTNVIDAAARGTAEGLNLALNVVAMLITFTALVALLNAALAWITSTVFFVKDPITIQQLFGYLMAPVAWLAGVSWGDAIKVGSLLSTKTVLNELIAYASMKESFAADPNFISPRSAIIATYALCGFANFTSIGIQIGCISPLAPLRRSEISRLGPLALLGGAIASLMSAATVGILL